MKNAKRSLLLSVLCLVLTVVLLAGTTFAWFTDSVSNAGNVITAGDLTLEATVYRLDSTNTGGTAYTIDGVNGNAPFYFAAQGQDLKTDPTPILNDSNWEPGSSNAKLVVLDNIGTLNAKVQMHFDITDNGLTDVLWYDFVMVDDSGAQLGQFQKRPMATIETYPPTVELSLAAGEAVSFVLVYGMETTADSSYMNKSFGGYLNILAKQDVGDGGGDYDASATYPDKTEPGVVPPEQALQEAVAALPGVDTITSADAAAVAAAMEQYQALTPEQQGRVTEAYHTLLTLTARLSALEQDAQAPVGRLLYEFESGVTAGTAEIKDNGLMAPANGGKYVYLNGADSSVTVTFYVPQAGNYVISAVSGSHTAEDRCDYLAFNGGTQYLVGTPDNNAGAWHTGFVGTENWVDGYVSPLTPEGGIALQEGWNTAVLSCNWSYGSYDCFYIQPVL